MSTGQQGQSTQQGQVTQQVSGMTAADRVAEFFKMVAETKYQPRLRFVSGVCRFDVEGAGSWRVEVKEGTVTVSKISTDDTSPADVVVTTTTDVMSRILAREGNMNFIAAMLQELATVRGDPAFAIAVIGGATFDQVGRAIFDQAAQGAR